jgi:isopropylmalate/homocitrate/citramalate synthase
VDEKIQIAKMLDCVGVEMIEAGDPSVSPNVAKAIEKIASLGLRAEVVAHSIASRSGIDRAKACGANRVAIFYATSKIHLDEKCIKLHSKRLKSSASMFVTPRVWD